MWLAFLNLGPSEVALILVLFLLLFGAERVPELARRVGQAKAQLDGVKNQVTSAFEDEEEKALREQLEFEAKREAHIRAMGDPDREDLARRAEALGLQTQGLSSEDLKAAIAARLAGEEGDASLGEEKPKNAANAQQ